MTSTTIRKVPKGISGNLGRPGHAGSVATEKVEAGQVHDKSEGLELSDILYKPLSFFKPHPDNQVFDRLKDERYLSGLRRDILEAGAIINPLVAMPDGTIIEGHSRFKIARELDETGQGLGNLPVRLILSQLTPDETRERVYLGNLSRFEIDTDTRALLYSRIWPEFFLHASIGGRPKKEDTMSSFPKAEEIAGLVHSTKRQLRRIAKTTRQANILAKADGRDTVTLEDIEIVRDAERRQLNAISRNNSASTSDAVAELSSTSNEEERHDDRNTDRVRRLRIELLALRLKSESAAESDSRQEWHRGRASAFTDVLAILDGLGS